MGIGGIERHLAHAFAEADQVDRGKDQRKRRAAIDGLVKSDGLPGGWWRVAGSAAENRAVAADSARRPNVHYLGVARVDDYIADGTVHSEIAARQKRPGISAIGGLVNPLSCSGI